MLVQLFFLLPLSFSKEGKFIQTKHMSGGVFGWHKALLSQRNLWASIPIPVKIYKTDINLTRLLDKTLDDKLPDFNISDFFSGLFDINNDEKSNSKILSKSTL